MRKKRKKDEIEQKRRKATIFFLSTSSDGSDSSQDPDFQPKPKKRNTNLTADGVWGTQTQHTQSQHNSQTQNQTENLHPNTTTRHILTNKPKAEPKKTPPTNPDTTHNRKSKRENKIQPLHASAAKKGWLNSNPTPPALTSDRPQPGDLVMATAGDIKHPAVDYHTVSPSYLIFGVVHSYTYVKLASREGGENWNNYTNNFKRLHVVREPIYATLSGLTR